MISAPRAILPEGPSLIGGYAARSSYDEGRVASIPRHTVSTLQLGPPSARARARARHRERPGVWTAGEEPGKNLYRRRVRDPAFFSGGSALSRYTFVDHFVRVRLRPRRFVPARCIA